MRRGLRDLDEAQRHDRWSFDDPAPRARPERQELRSETRDDETPDEAQRAAPPPARKPGISPWQKIAIPDAERQRAAAAGLYRYVGKPAVDMYEARRAAPIIEERFAPPIDPPPSAAPPDDETPEDETPEGAAPIAAPSPEPEAPRQPTEDAKGDEEFARAFASAQHARRQRPMPAYERRRAASAPPPAHGNPHLGLTVGVIIAVSLAAAVGLSWVATPAMDGAAALRAAIIQRVAPQTPAPTAEQPAARAPANAPSSIEVAPERPRAAPSAAPAQPIEVAP